MFTLLENYFHDQIETAKTSVKTTVTKLVKETVSKHKALSTEQKETIEKVKIVPCCTVNSDLGIDEVLKVILESNNNFLEKKRSVMASQFGTMLAQMRTWCLQVKYKISFTLKQAVPDNVIKSLRTRIRTVTISNKDLFAGQDVSTHVKKLWDSAFLPALKSEFDLDYAFVSFTISFCLPSQRALNLFQHQQKIRSMLLHASSFKARTGRATKSIGKYQAGNIT